MNELICVLVNSTGKISNVNITLVFTDFYTTNEISLAKKLLYDLVEKLVPKSIDEIKK